MVRFMGGQLCLAESLCGDINARQHRKPDFFTHKSKISRPGKKEIPRLKFYYNRQIIHKAKIPDRLHTSYGTDRGRRNA